MPVKFGFVIFARCICRHVLMQMLIGGAAARRQLVAWGLENHVAAAARNNPALFARRLHVIPACAVETLQQVTTRYSVELVLIRAIRQPQATRKSFSENSVR